MYPCSNYREVGGDEGMDSRKDILWNEEERVQIGLYIDLLKGRNINHYKKVTKAISDGMEKPVQDLVREIFRRARIERNIVMERLD
ncbi:hypothetical protein [Propionigenium maris]|nr:hypothetical protein [Propionigenium maris]